MTAADEYRVQGARFDAMAKLELNPLMRREWELMALAYRRLAQLADRNSNTDIVYETPPERPQVLPQEQQQQQSKKNED
jgi:hypothetical protein